MRLGDETGNGIRAVSIFITALTGLLLVEIFFDSLYSCLLLAWMYTAGHIEAPVVGERESDWIVLLSYACAATLVWVMGKRLTSVFQGKSAKWYIVLTIPQIVIAVVMFVANWGASHGVMVRSGGNMGLYYDQIFSHVGFCILTALSMFALWAYLSGMNRIYLEQEKNSQYHAQVAVYKMQEEQYRQAERLRHDLKNHVIAMTGLWEDKEWEKLGNYLRKMENGAELGAFEEATGSRVVDVLLYRKRKMTEEKGFVWDCDVKVPKQCGIHEFDLCVLFGNILDNAVEACGRLEDGEKGEHVRPFVRIQAGAVKKCFYLEVKNSTGTTERRRGSLQTADRKSHGIGLLNVGDVVRRYNGAMHTEIQSGVYTISVLIPMEMPYMTAAGLFDTRC